MRKHLQWLETAGLLASRCRRNAASRLFSEHRLPAAALLGIVAGLTASAVTPRRGYLSTLGPAPLCFRLPVAEKPFLLPPLRQPKTEGLNATTAGTNSPVPQADAALAPQFPAPPPVPPPDEWLQPGGTPPALPAMQTQNEAAARAAINPQSVLGYLTPGPTNALPERFLPPVFVPPPPPLPPPSSRATYERQ